MSNVGWKDVDEEFAEYFGDTDDYEESDSESVRSAATTTELEVGKRKRNLTPGDHAPDGEGDVPMEGASNDVGSRLSKRRKLARERAAAGSALRDVEVSIDEHEEEAGGDAGYQEDEGSDGDSLAVELERELLGLGDPEANEAGEGGG